MIPSYLISIKKQFRYYKSLGDKTFEQLNPEKLHWQPNEASNSIAVIVKHIVGNMLSRWTNFTTEDGEKEWRERDQEFIDTYQSKEALLESWEKGWKCLFDALNHLSDEDLNNIVYIRNQGHTIAEAINRQLAHYPYHIGQIVYLGRMILDNEWQSLSIPKGESSSFNEKKFNQQKERGHYTDDFLNSEDA